MDVHALDPGDPFPLRIQNELQSCDVLIALIGHSWEGQDASTGRSRLENSTDFVRAELTMAVENGLIIIPILVDGSQLPDELPSSLSEIRRRHAMSLNHQTFDADVERLYRVLDGMRSAIRPRRWLVVGLVALMMTILGYLVVVYWPYESHWDGIWDYTFQGRAGGRTAVFKGHLTLITRSSDHVKGDYTNEEGRSGSLDGTLVADGSRINGLWTSGSESGQFYFALEPDGLSFRGGYSTDPDISAEDNPHNFWNGIRDSTEVVNEQ
jgi:hypothetical protein